MKEIDLVRQQLGKIRGALDDGEADPSKKPRITGDSKRIERADLAEITIDPEGSRPSDDDFDELRGPQEFFDHIEARYETEGFDVLAWYHPFHLSGSKWGIYVPQSSLHYISERWLDHRMKFENRIAKSLEILLLHEVVHFMCEYSVSQHELFIQAPCWAPARQRLRQAKLDYFFDEEALANAHCIRELRSSSSSALIGRVEAKFASSPPGYRDYALALSDQGYEDHVAEVVRHNVGVTASDLDLGLLDPGLETNIFWPSYEQAMSVCPLYIINDIGHVDLPELAGRIITSIPNIVETKRFTRQFRKLERKYQDSWYKMKMDLKISVPRAPKFKKFKGFFAVYLIEGYRAHLAPTGKGVWEAFEIGDHDGMGHG